MDAAQRREPTPATVARLEVDGVVVQLAMLVDGTCIVGGLIPYDRYQFRLENEKGETMAAVTADDGTFALTDPPQGRLRLHIDPERRTEWIER